VPGYHRQHLVSFFFLFCVSYPLHVQLGGSVTETPPVPPGTPSATPRLPSGIPHPVVGRASVGAWASCSVPYVPLDAAFRAIPHGIARKPLSIGIRSSRKSYAQTTKNAHALQAQRRRDFVLARTQDSLSLRHVGLGLRVHRSDTHLGRTAVGAQPQHNVHQPQLGETRGLSMSAAPACPDVPPHGHLVGWRGCCDGRFVQGPHGSHRVCLQLRTARPRRNHRKGDGRQRVSRTVLALPGRLRPGADAP